MLNLIWVGIVNQTIMPTNIGIPKRKTPNLLLGQKVIIEYTVGVQMVGLMQLKIKGFFRKSKSQRLHPNSPKMFKQT
jgi:hypothetical protein